jgi:hypothetical protein
MKKILLLIIFITAYLPQNAYASNDDATEKAQQIIDACWAISEGDRSSGNTPRMRSGTLDSALCMERVFLKLITNYLFKNDLKKLQIFENNIQNLRSGYGGLIWDLYNDHDGCTPSCGTMYHVAHNGAYVDVLESILHRAFLQIIDYKLQDELLGVDLLINASAQKAKKQILDHIPTKELSFCFSQISPDHNQCGQLSVTEIHSLFVLEARHQEPYSELARKNFLHFVTVKGFIQSATKDAFSFLGTIETNDPNALNERCSEYGHFTFIKQEDNVWKLNVEASPCFQDKKVLIITN